MDQEEPEIYLEPVKDMVRKLRHEGGLAGAYWVTTLTEYNQFKLGSYVKNINSGKKGFIIGFFAGDPSTEVDVDGKLIQGDPVTARVTCEGGQSDWLVSSLFLELDPPF